MRRRVVHLDDVGGQVREIRSAQVVVHRRAGALRVDVGSATPCTRIAQVNGRRGALRDLPQPAVFGIVLLTVAVGYLLPVLGVSLLLFLAGDAVAGAVARRRAAGRA